MFRWWEYFEEPKQFYIVKVYQTNGKIGYLHSDMFRNYISKNIEEHILIFKTREDISAWFERNAFIIKDYILDWSIEKITINVKVDTEL